MKKAVFFIIVSFVFFSSCYEIDEALYVSPRIKTKNILNKNALHLSDTLYIVEPFTKVYRLHGNGCDTFLIKKHFKNWGIYMYWGRFFLKPDSVCYFLFPKAERQISAFAKMNFEKYFTCFNNKKELGLTPGDSIFISEQMNGIKQKLLDSAFQKIPIPDSLYNCLIKYGRKQFLITDILEFFQPGPVYGSNLFTFHRFFIFDILSKQLSFYTYSFSLTDGGARFDIHRSDFKTNLKKYNRKIRRGYRQGLREKKKERN